MTRRPRCRVTVLACIAVLTAAASVRSTSAQHETVALADVLSRAGTRVEEFFARAQSLVCTETVHLQPLNSSLGADGFGRTVESELRVSWDAGRRGASATEAKAERVVVKVNGRPPREKDPRACTTPEQQASETQPLSMLLPEQRGKFAFAAAGTARIDGHTAWLVDFKEVATVSTDVSTIEGLPDCVSYEVHGGMRGRLWVDRDTYDVLRLDERLIGMVELRLPQLLTRRPGGSPSMTLEREDTSWRFARVAFDVPPESLVLPVSATSLRVTRGAGAPRMRTTTKYSGYRRFLTGGRLVG